MKKLFTLILIFIAATFQSNAQLVINEIDYDQPSADSAEFIELYNAGTSPVDLSIYSVVLITGSNNTKYDSIALPNTTLASHAYFVICAGHAGRVANCDTARSGFTIQNGSPDAVILRDNITLTIVDAVSYEGSCAPPYVSGNGVPLAQSDTLNSGATGAANNFLGISRFPDGMDTNDDSTDFHRYCSTPGAANVNVTTGCTPTSLKPVKAKNAVSIYPNPSSGFLHFEMEGNQLRNASLTVSNILGNEMKKVTLKNSELSYQLDLTDLQDGIYFVKVKSDAGESVHRVILKK